MGSLEPQIFQKYKASKIWAGQKNTHTHTFVSGSAGEHHVCKNSGHISQKKAWTSDSEGIWGDELEQACSHSKIYLRYKSYSRKHDFFCEPSKGCRAVRV